MHPFYARSPNGSFVERLFSNVTSKYVTHVSPTTGMFYVVTSLGGVAQ